MVIAPKFSLYIDIGALRDRHYTGIPRVVLEIARYWHSNRDVRCNFFFDEMIVPPQICDLIVADERARTWPQALLDITERFSVYDALRQDPLPTIGLFPTHRKPAGLPFSRTVQIIHDLTTILVPETHGEALLRHEATAIESEIQNSDHVVTVSHTTKLHIETYLGTDGDKVTAVHLGADPAPHLVEELIGKHAGVRTEPFVLVLGTVEVRKNVGLILEALANNPSLLRKYRWIFTGRIRPNIFEALEPHLQRLRPALEKQRIAFLGYVSELSKNLLLRKAEFSVYASRFEGFGLPVAEALWHGCPVVCSISTSIPEVAQDAGRYFDPFSVDDLGRVLLEASKRTRGQRVKDRDRTRAVGARYTWQKFNRQLGEVLERVIDTQSVAIPRIADEAQSRLQRPSRNRLSVKAGAWDALGVTIEADQEDTLLIVSENDERSLHAVSQTAEASATETWSAAIDARALGRAQIIIQLDDEGSNASQSRFDLTTGTIMPGSTYATGESRFVTSVIEPIGGGWWRCGLVGSPNVKHDKVRLLVYVVNEIPIYEGDCRSAVMLARPQLELGSYPTSYVSNLAEDDADEGQGGGTRAPDAIDGACFGMVAGGIVKGWVWRPSNPHERFRVALVDGDVRVAEADAGEFRGDLVRAGKGDGCYGFSLVMPAAPCDKSLKMIILDQPVTLPGATIDISEKARRAALDITPVGVLNNVEYDELSHRWLLTGIADRVAGSGGGRALEIRLGNTVLANTVANIAHATNPEKLGFVFSIDPLLLPQEIVSLDVVETGTRRRLWHAPVLIDNQSSRLPLRVEALLATHQPTVDTVMANIPEIVSQDNVEQILSKSYTYCLGREPDEVGRSTYCRLLTELKITPRELVKSLLESQESRSLYTPAPILPEWMSGHGPS